MRPEILNIFFANIESLSGVGKVAKEELNKLNIYNIRDLLFHMPFGYIDRTKSPSLEETIEGELITTTITPEKYINPMKRPSGKTSPFKVICYNETGFITLTFFQKQFDYLKRQLPLGEKRVVSGRVDYFDGERQINQPDYIAVPEKIEHIAKIEAKYPATANLSSRKIGNIITNALDKISELPEWLNQDTIEQEHFKSFVNCLNEIHKPKQLNDNNYLERLAYDELLATQLNLTLYRKTIGEEQGVSIANKQELFNKLTLPFELTSDQNKAITEIAKDLASSKKMERLLQGDVGSGKTIVALAAMLDAVESGYQAILMAPTEILARQHYENITSTCKHLDLKITLLARTVNNKPQLLADIASGNSQIIIGTHSLFQETVAFKNPGIAVIDEQHRFGVTQRRKLSDKASGINLLLMSATPIPRSLAMVIYNDLDISTITEKPANRKPIKTLAMPAIKINDITKSLNNVIAKGEKIYWVCPHIQQQEESNIISAKERFSILQKHFSNKVALVHGQIDSKTRERTLEEFKSGDKHILVATTVIEVGVDIKDATTIIIEHANNFGLSQLHQLRGRVGRNDKPATCILLYDDLNENGRKRLNIMKESNDGFYLAEQDLILRGGGDVLGTKQSGLPDYKFAKIPEHLDLLKKAGIDAKHVIKSDPGLKSQRGQNLKLLSFLFGC